MAIQRTSHGLRDLLFDEIEELRSGKGDPIKAMAVANLAKQILQVARVELDFHRQLRAAAEQGAPIKMGTLELGAGVVSVTHDATEPSSDTTAGTQESSGSSQTAPSLDLGTAG